tara:strand:- start:9112 stop:10311 length:1200 start_codon:yes stop_codon:yes gene_type:complete
MNMPPKITGEWFHDAGEEPESMVRVLVIGAGLAGLACALEATTAGHHVVLLERSSRIGGRGTTQNLDGFAMGYGPHLFVEKGPLHSLVRKLSRVRISTSPVKLHRLEVVGHGVVRPIDDTTTAVLNKRALKQRNPNNPLVKACDFFSTWGGGQNEQRALALRKERLLVCNEGWAGLVGRLAAALDEVGVFVECGPEVVRIEKGSVHLRDGRMIETDVVVLACGVVSARKLLSSLDDELSGALFSKVKRVSASIIEAGLDAKPLSGRHAVVDAEGGFSILDYHAIHPLLGPGGSHLSALSVGGLAGDAGETRYESASHRLEALKAFLGQRASGWNDHIIHYSQQEKITLHETVGGRIPVDAAAHKGVLFAGPWTESAFILADAAIDSGRQAGRSVSSALR